jgi:Holliday junction DNA helicase RuvA
MARPVKEIADAIARQDSKWLSTLPGIGATTAEQIVTTLKRKVTRFAMMSAPPAPPEPAPDAVVDEKANGKKATGKKKAEAVAEPEPLFSAADGQLIDDVYQSLMGLGLNPIEARAKLDGLLTCGKPFKNLQDALTMIYAQKG